MLLSEILNNPIYRRRTNAELANAQAFEGIPQTEWKGQTMKEKLASRPSMSAATKMSSMMADADPYLGYAKGGNLLTALTSGLKTGLGFYGAIKDAQAQEAYNQLLAEQQAQDRTDKLAQQAFENDYKNRELAQKEALQQGQFSNQKEIAQMNIDAANARANIAREQALYDADVKRQQALEDVARNREYAIADKELAKQQALDLEEQKRQNAIADMIAKGLRPEEAQKYLNNPQAYDVSSRGWYNPARWFGAKNTIKPNKKFSNLSNEELLKGL